MKATGGLLRYNACSVPHPIKSNGLRAHLDPDLKNHVHVSDVRGPTAIVVCSSAAIATRMRFLTPQLLQSLKHLQSFSGVTDIALRVANHA